MTDEKRQTEGFAQPQKHLHLHVSDEKGQAEQFALAGRQKRPGLVREFWDFLKHNKKWWLMPILIILLLIGLLVVLAGSGVGAWMYTVF